MTETIRLDDALRAAAQDDPETEARLLLALAHAPDELAAAYASGRLLSEAPRLIRGLIARLGELRAEAASASTSSPLSADALFSLPRGTIVRSEDGRYWLCGYDGWEAMDWGEYSQNSLLMAGNSPRLAGHIDLGQEDA